MADDTATSANGKSGDAAAAPSPFTSPQISLPKGGGAIRGIGEKFAANPATGAGSFTVPIPTSPGRSGFGPQLSLSYDSTGPNGAFGMGCSLSLQEIRRKTDKGLPVFRDAEEEEPDVFILSGSEDLVPILLRDCHGHWVYDHFERDGYRVKRYRPRIEGLFARIERWTRIVDGDTHWRSISKDNILTVYGIDAQSRIADPHEPRHVFSWLICRGFDDKGNAIVYEYAAENDEGIDLSRPNERHRVRTANRYLKRVKYGNRRPLLLDPDTPSFRKSHVAPLDLDGAGWMFEVVFDYGADHYREEPPDQDGWTFAHAQCARRPKSRWATRKDPFSTYRSGFEVRTYRLCRRILMFHHFPDELGCDDYLVRSTALHYREKSIGSFITRVVQSGHKRHPDGRYLTRSLPPLDLDYTTSPLEDGEYRTFRIKEVEPASLANLPEGIDGTDYRFIDLDGEGISGVLAEQSPAWFYKPNLGEGHFGATQVVSPRPSLAALSGGRQQLLDLAGDGNLDLVMLEPPVPGFYPRTREAGWADFRPFRRLPVQDWNDPNLRFVDLTGDGIADVLITEDDAFTWHRSLLEEGFGEAVRVRIPTEEEKGPRVIFDDGTQSIYLADMSGDGLSDLVRVRNGEVCYWPHRGYGRFGAKVTMDRSPWFDQPDLFDQQRVRLADTDGNGLTDILYLGRDGISVFLNESGNSWSTARLLEDFPIANNVAAVSVVDFLGRGTACLVWSSPLPSDTGRPLRYVDLMDGRKPHLLSRVKNNLGAETVVEYASSTEFYLADKAAGTPWLTRLAFPVHVVRRVETYDFVSRNRFVSRYTYHHGYYDGVEREFRGFGRVDQLDTEEFATLGKSAAFPVGDNIDAASNVPPVLTKTWFHTGVYIAGGAISRHMAHEYYREGDPRNGEGELTGAELKAMLLDDTVLPEHIGPEDAREACRALKGATLRQEVYGLDGTEAACRPYTVSESNTTVRTLQPRRTNRHGVFFAHARESIQLNYERTRDDPRISHALTLSVDEYGNVLKSAAIGYRRRQPAFDEQAVTLATIAEAQYTNTACEADSYRSPLIAELKTYQLTGPDIAVASPLQFIRVAALAAAATEIAYDERPHPRRTNKQLIEQTRTFYRKNDLSAFLPLGKLEIMALPGETYKQALTPGLLETFSSKVSVSELTEILARRAAGYRDLDGTGPYWIPSGRAFYSPDADDSPFQESSFARQHFFVPRRFQDAFGNITTVSYEKNNLAVVLTRDALGNEIRAELDYRILQPIKLTDPNGNRTEARFDALGMLVGTALMGKPSGSPQGDSFYDFAIDLTSAQCQEFFDSAAPQRLALQHLGTATTRIVYHLDRVPACVASITRETHVSALEADQRTKLQIYFSYSDGFARVAQTRIQAEPATPPNGCVESPQARWVATGARIYNNKGKPVRQYEPYFSGTPQFGIEERGVSTTWFYDPLLRLIASHYPNRTFDKVVFDPWKQIVFDVNDTVTFNPVKDPDVGQFFSRLADIDDLPTWYRQRVGGALGPNEKTAAEKAAAHADTPTISHFDTLGRAFLSIADNGADTSGTERRYLTRTLFDIKGNQREVIDALDRVIVRYDHDMLGRRIHQKSMEGGAGWILNDAAGEPILAWNSRNFLVRSEYDALRRPSKSFVRGGDHSEANAETFARETLFERTIYGDSIESKLTEWEQKHANLRGKVFQHLDSSGVLTIDLYDFKGNPLRNARRFVQDYRTTPDWSESPALDTETFRSATTYDALNRAIAVTAPDGSIYRPTFNEGNLLKAVDVALRGALDKDAPIWEPFVGDVEYNARGQRALVRYANGATTCYDYDNKTFRLIRLKTTRPVSENRISASIFRHADVVQDLHYIYDPAGNITRIEDAALKIIFNANERLDAASDFTYDAVYRLIEATGREHIGQSAFVLHPSGGNFRDYPFVGAAQLDDLEALRRYSERYDYDAVGNFERVRHLAANGNWTRRFIYEEASLLDAGRNSNRLSETALATHDHPSVQRYSYDAHGNITRMPHLSLMQWNFKDELSATSRQVVNTGSSETTYYVYGADGQRARKVTARQNGMRRNERLYLGGFEVYREFNAGGSVTFERQTLRVMDDKQTVCQVETHTIDQTLALTSPTPTLRYQLTNHLGSASLELDAGAGLISYEEYSPYGNTPYQAARSTAELSLKRYRYTGKERDEENGFTYHGARYYAPWLGRWTAADPIGVRGGVNLYAYVGGNPISSVDSTGTDDDKVVDQSDPYGGTSPPGGAPPQADAPSPPQANSDAPQPDADVPPADAAPPASPDNNPSPPPSPDNSAPPPTQANAAPDTQPQQMEISETPKDVIARQEDAAFLSFDLDPDKLDLPDAFQAFYEVGYYVKQGIYKPIRNWVAPETKYYLDAEQHVQISHIRQDHTDAAIAIAQIGSVFLDPETLAASDEANVGLVSQTLENANYLKNLNKSGGVPAEAKIVKGNQVLASVEDQLTGVRSLGRGSKIAAQDLYPALREELEPYLEVVPNQELIEGSGDLAIYGPPGAHAEINALNRALWARDPTGKLLTVADFSSFDMVSVWLGKGGPYVMPRCPNCWFMTPNVNYLGPIGPRPPP